MDESPPSGQLSSPTITLVVWLAWAWIAMTITHELGHVFVGILSGAELRDLELRPWHLPHSLFVSDSYPLITLWAGPIIGCLVPCIVAIAISKPSVWFVAWFCVLSNGVYLLLGLWAGDPELDSTKLLQAGARPSHLWLAIAITLPVSYAKFRRACVSLFSGTTPAMTKQQSQVSGIALLVTITFQAVTASLIR
ncbi:MAG: M50 family metallopeptidase [Rubripirellula sp.]